MLVKGSAWDGAGKHDPKPQAGLVSTGICFLSPQVSAIIVLPRVLMMLYPIF